MNVYQLGSSHIVWFLQPDDGTRWRDFDAVDGTPRRATWSPLGVKFASDQLHPSGPYPDVNLIRHVPVFSSTAVDHLSDVLPTSIELLPLRCASTELSALNVPIVDGALDVDASEVERLDGGRIIWVDEFIFHAEAIERYPMFRPAELSSAVFVNQDFVNTALKAGLSGCRAEAVWIEDAQAVCPIPPELDRGRTLSALELASLDSRALDEYVWDVVCAASGSGRGGDLARMSSAARSFYSTRLFEWEIGNGGLHQFFFNHPEPEVIEAVADGYELFGVPQSASTVREVVAPFAARGSAWRESLRDGRIETFFESYPESQLDQFEHRVGHHDVERLNYVRANPTSFTR